MNSLQNYEPNLPKIPLDLIRQNIDPKTLIFTSPAGFQSRTDEVEESYQIEKAVILKDWRSLEDYCKVLFLKYLCLRGGGKGNKLWAGKGEKSKSSSCEVNTFFWNVENCEHWTLWLDETADQKLEIENQIKAFESRGFPR